MNAASLADRMLGSVGDPNIQPHYVGDPNIRPRYVGAPVNLVQGNPNAPIDYSEQTYVDGNVTWFGLGTQVIAAGATAVVDKKPLRPMTPQSFRMPSTTQGLLVSQISISGETPAAGQDGTPQEFFSEVSTAPQLVFPTINEASGVQITLINPTAANITFSGAFYGTALRR